MEHLRKSRENYHSFSGFLCPFKNPSDPYITPGDNENCVAGFSEYNISHKRKLIAFVPDASPHMVSQPKLNQSSICPVPTLSFQNNNSFHFLENTSSQINLPSTSLDLKPMNANITEVDDGHQKKTDIMNKTKEMPLFERKRNPEMPHVIKGHWTPEEDRLLEQLVEDCGVQKWSQIAQWLKGRAGKQCRERWHNHLRPDIKKDKWSEEEEQILVNLHRQLGNKWSKIAKDLPGRSENSIKNHWNSAKRELLTLRRRNKTNKNSNNSPLKCYMRSFVSGIISVEGRPYVAPILKTRNVLKGAKCSLVKDVMVNDQLSPTHCNGGGHYSNVMESTSSREEGTTSMPKDLPTVLSL